VTAVLIDLDGALGDTRPLWEAWLESSARVLAIEPATLPENRGEAAARLDAAGAGNWRALLERFAEERLPVYLRPNAEVSAALRRLAAAEHRVGVFTDAPVELATLALAQLGATRRVDVLTCGTRALSELEEAVGPGGLVVSTRAELAAL
jgi:phosphoglycolate phosphatase-like HAD superfamily hydrolase